MVEAGVGPATETPKAADAAQGATLLAEEHSFGAVVEAFAERKLGKQRRGARVHHRLLTEVVPILGSKTLAEIGRQDVVALIERIVDRTNTGSYAHNVLQDVRAV